jgi:hypothetical protein
VIAALAAGLIARPWARTALRWGAVALAVILFLLSFRRAGERTGRIAERLETMEKSDDVQRQMLDAAARRPHSRSELARRLRDGRF